MKKDKKLLHKGSEILMWAEKMSIPIGLWPLSQNHYLFSIYVIYYTSYVILALVDLYKSSSNTISLLENVTESLSIISVYVRMLLFRINISSLEKILSQVFKDFNVDDFESSHEIEVFIQFLKKGIYLLRGFVTFMLSTEIIWYVGSLISTPESIIDDNNQTIFIIPYNIDVLVDVNTLAHYYLIFLCLLPSIWVFAFSIVSMDSILISLLFYITGRIAVLTIRINALKKESNHRKNLNKIIIEHCKLLKIGNGVKDAYSSGLLVYLLNINFIVCILGYQTLICVMSGQYTGLIRYGFFLVEMYSMLSIHCVISEHLTNESLKCCEAYYNCLWYDLPIDCIKDIIFCIKRSQKPLALSAGKFTTFSNVTLTNVTKAAASYLSILRNFMINE